MHRGRSITAQGKAGKFTRSTYNSIVALIRSDMFGWRTQRVDNTGLTCFKLLTQ